MQNDIQSMSQDADPVALLQDIIKTCLLLLEYSAAHPSDLLCNLEKIPEFFADWAVMSDYFKRDPAAFSTHYLAYSQAAQKLLQDQCQQWSGDKSIAMQQDRRFASKDWTEHPFFQLISQHYVLFEKHLLSMVAQMPVTDQPSVKRIQFLLQQLAGALSPENFLLTNPQLLSQTIASNGVNLLYGLRHFLQDLQRQNWTQWRMPLTDQDAFVVGKDLAVTPGKVIYQNELIELIQYTPQTSVVHTIPLLMVPPWINKYYILDLCPENSLVRWLVSQGIVVYILSWRNPGQAHAHWSVSDYLHLGPIAAIEFLQNKMNIAKISALGFCIGGTLLSLLLAYYAAQQKDVIVSATLLASLIDFSEPGDLGVFIHEQQIQTLEKRMQIQGYLDGAAMAAAFHSLRPGELIWRVFTQRYLYGQPLMAFDLLFWNMDTTNMPATMQSEYLRHMYLHNDLIKPGKLKIKQVPIDVTKIKVPTFFLSTQKDHIALWQSTYRGFQLMSGPKTFVLGGSGHIAGIVNPPHAEKYGYYTNPMHPVDAEDWMAQAEYHPGSWWPEWLLWLKSYAGESIQTEQLSDRPILYDAPGKYVYE